MVKDMEECASQLGSDFDMGPEEEVEIASARTVGHKVPRCDQ